MSPLTKSCLLAALGLALAAVTRAEVKIGAAFPKLESAGLSGNLPDTVGKIVIVDFWASWCAPCKESFPFYGKLQQEYAARGVVIVAVSVDQKSADYDSFVKKLKPAFTTVHDREQKLVGAVKVPTMPTSYLLDRNGKVRAIHDGYHGEHTELVLRKEIDALLAEKN